MANMAKSIMQKMINKAKSSPLTMEAMQLI